MSCGSSVSVSMRLNVLAAMIRNRIDTDTWPVSLITLHSFGQVKRRLHERDRPSLRARPQRPPRSA